MKPLMFVHIAYKNLSRRKFQAFLSVSLMSITLLLIILSLSLMSSAKGLLDTLLINDINHRTLLVSYFPGDRTKDEVMEEVRGVDHVIEAFHSNGLFGGQIASISNFERNDIKGSNHLRTQPRGTKSIPKIIAGRPFNEGESNVGLIPKDFYLNDDWGDQTTKEKVKFIDGEELIGKTITITYTAADHTNPDPLAPVKTSKTFEYSFTVIGVFDGVKNHIEPNTAIVPYWDVIAMADNVEQHTKYGEDHHEALNRSFIAIIDRQDNVKKTVSLLEDLGYFGTPRAQIGGVFDAVRLITLIGLTISGLLSILAFIVITTTTFHSIKKRAGEIGMLKAVGYTDKNIARIISFEMLLTGAISVVVVFILFIMLIIAFYYIRVNYLSMYLREFRLVISGLGVVAAMVIGLFVPVFAGRAAIDHALSIEPTEALRQ